MRVEKGNEGGWCKYKMQRTGMNGGGRFAIEIPKGSSNKGGDILRIGQHNKYSKKNPFCLLLKQWAKMRLF